MLTLCFYDLRSCRDQALALRKGLFCIRIQVRIISG